MLWTHDRHDELDRLAARLDALRARRADDLDDGIAVRAIEAQIREVELEIARMRRLDHR